MSQSLVELFEWNAWANQKHREIISKVPFDDLKIETPYGILLDRIVHIFGSFKMWYDRMQGKSPDTAISADQFDNWDDLAATWEEYDQLLLDYVRSISTEKLEEEVTYQSFNGKWYTRKIEHILIHLTTHPNYHRGQISAIFKLKEMPNFPSVDPVFYYLETGQASINDTPPNK